ncbi:hypothetical protein Tco_0847286 [Tanacetum coccineum]
MPKIDECPKNLGSDVAKKSKIPSQAPRGVPVGPKVRFKPVKQLYRLISKKNNVNGNKKTYMESTKENVGSSCISTTFVVDKIAKIEKLIIDEKIKLVDDEVAGTRYSLKDKIEDKPDKTESGIGKSVKNQSQRVRISLLGDQDGLRVKIGALFTLTQQAHKA